MGDASKDFKLVIGTHDLSLVPVAEGDELICWMPFPAFRSLYSSLDKQTARHGVALEITSDDAFISDYDLLLPWLLDTGRTATFFIPTGFLGRPNRLTAAQLREMHRLGMSIGTHGIRHVNWANLSDAELREDVGGGIAALEDVLGARVTAAAPPFGGYNFRVTQLLEAHGITEIHTCDGGYATTSGRLRARMAVAQDSASNLRIVDLSRRRPGPVDRWRGEWHRLKASPNLPWRRNKAIETQPAPRPAARAAS